MTRRPVVDQVRIESMGASRYGKATTERSIIRFAFSEDVMDRLFALHDKLYKPFIYGLTEGRDRYKNHRIEFARFRDIGIPGILVRIEAPSFAPHGVRMWRPKGSRRYFAQIAARKLRVKSNIATQNLETLWDEDNLMRGIICIFPDDDMEYPGEKVELRKWQREIPINDQDMTVR